MARPNPSDGLIKVLVVDDSAFMSYLITKELSADPAIQVVGTARDGLDALKKIADLRPDVVTMDVEMPRMDGLTALERVMKEQPVPVILLSTLTQEGAAVTIQGLEHGAVDFVQKPSAVRASSSRETWESLIAKVKAASRTDVRRLGRVRPRVARPAVLAMEPALRAAPRRFTRVVVIGTSTGGPRALFDVVPHLPRDLPAAVLIVQHMPPGFTKSLAGRLNDVSNIEVREATDGDSMSAGVALLAPGDFHMVVRRGGSVGLEKSPSLHGVRPAVDITMESAASVFGSSVLGVIMTGMGRDGTAGSVSIRRSGGYVIAEDESTCVVYGMPRSVQEAGAADQVTRLDGIAASIVEAVSQAPREAARRL